MADSTGQGPGVPNGFYNSLADAFSAAGINRFWNYAYNLATTGSGSGDPNNTNNPVINDSNFTQPTYDFTSRVFPANLGEASYVGHYMIININVQVSSTLNQATRTTSGGSVTNVIGTPFQNQFSKVDILRFNIDNQFGRGQLNIQGARNTRRIAESIALFMPSSQINFTTLNEYTDVSLTGFAGMLTGGSIEAGGAIENFAQAIGHPIKPTVEVLYANTALREFVFELLMVATTPAEAETIKQIIKTLRFHAAPEQNTSTLGFTFLAPSEFDITFYHRGVENTHIPRINTCVLEQIDVNYAPTSIWATHYDGHPLAVQLMLRFREVEIVHKLRVLQGF